MVGLAASVAFVAVLGCGGVVDDVALGDAEEGVEELVGAVSCDCCGLDEDAGCSPGAGELLPEGWPEPVAELDGDGAADASRGNEAALSTSPAMTSSRTR